VVIRSHGAPPRVHEQLAARGLAVVDATCPFVKKLHRHARRLRQEGYRVVIVGDRSHSEITSLTDDPAFEGLVVAGPADLDGVKISGRYGLTAQTTQTHENLQAVATRILPQVLELRVFNTICDSTATRQTEARELAARVDVMVVIGGRNSANTRRLAEICQETGTRTVWVETADELSPELVGDAAHVGLTAGASTPEWIITEVIRRLAALPAGAAGAGTATNAVRAMARAAGRIRVMGQGSVRPRRDESEYKPSPTLMFRRHRPIHPLTSGAAGAGVLDTQLAGIPARHTRHGEPRVHRPAPPRCNWFHPRRFLGGPSSPVPLR
jgi:4-hydroxy-3-methylbut-2-enyl diphosphate reductase